MRLFSKQGNWASQPAWIKGYAQSWLQTLNSPAAGAELGRQGITAAFGSTAGRQKQEAAPPHSLLCFMSEMAKSLPEHLRPLGEFSTSESTLPNSDPRNIEKGTRGPRLGTQPVKWCDESHRRFPVRVIAVLLTGWDKRVKRKFSQQGGQHREEMADRMGGNLWQLFIELEINIYNI